MSNGSTKRTVIFYRDDILPLSETFIGNQAKTIREYAPCFVGSRKIENGFDVDGVKTILINEGNSISGYLKEKLFKLTLRPPLSLIRTLNDMEPSLIHAHFAFDAVYALPLAESLGVPLLVSLLGYDVTQYDEVWKSSKYFSCKMFPKRRERLFKSKRTHFIAISEDLKKVAIQRGYPEERISVHHVGVDTDRFTPSGTLCKDPMVLFVGRLVEKKGVVYLLRAMKKVQDAMPDAKVTIIGDGPLRASLEEEARALSINAVFLGPRDNEFVRAQMTATRVVCVPSVTGSTGDTEGLPIVVWEAMALGKPIVASHSAGIPEAIFHGRTGLISPEKDSDGLAENILKLLTSDALCEELAISARRECEERFSLQKQNTKLERIYSSLIIGNQS